MKTVITLKESNNYELKLVGEEFFVYNKKSGKPMTETNGTVTLSTDSGRKRYKVADLISNNQTKSKTRRSAEIKVTDLEKSVINAILDNEYMSLERDDEKVIDYPCWTFVCEDSGVKGKKLSGVISSLVKKGIIGTLEEGKESTVWITKLGFNLIQKITDWNVNTPDQQGFMGDIPKEEPKADKKAKTEKKARLKVGDTKIGKDGIERIYSKTPSGFDWRRVKKTKKSNDTKKK